MSRSQFQSKIFILRHAWLNLWDERMTTGRINQVAIHYIPSHWHCHANTSDAKEETAVKKSTSLKKHNLRPVGVSFLSGKEPKLRSINVSPSWKRDWLHLRSTFSVPQQKLHKPLLLPKLLLARKLSRMWFSHLVNHATRDRVNVQQEESTSAFFKNNTTSSSRQVQCTHPWHFCNTKAGFPEQWN